MGELVAASGGQLEVDISQPDVMNKIMVPLSKLLDQRCREGSN